MEKTSLSSYLCRKKGLLKRMIEELSHHYSYVSVLGTDTQGTSFSVRSNAVSVTDSNWNEQGFVIRVYQNKQYSEFSLNDLSEENYTEWVQKILSHEQETAAAKIEVVAYPVIREEPLSGVWQSEAEIPFESLNTQSLLRRMAEMKDQLHHASALVVNAGVNLQTVKVAKLFLSPNRDLMQSYTWSEGFVYACVQREKQYRMGFRVSSGLKGAEILDHLPSLIQPMVKDTISLLDADRVIPGEYDIICSPSVSGLIAHEAFGHGVEMDMFVKNRAKAKEYLGKPVASPCVNMHDGAKSYSQVSSYWFDDEGVLGTDTAILESGILKRGINDQLTAMVLQVAPTGNGKRESFERKAYSRMTNTFFCPGTDTLEDMIRSVKHGYLLEYSENGMEDPKNWGIQCVSSFGREIQDGQFTGKIVAPVIITGYVPDLLQSISMISGDLELEGSGGCGKGHKEFVKVSAGGPYLKTKGWLS